MKYFFWIFTKYVEMKWDRVQEFYSNPKGSDDNRWYFGGQIPHFTKLRFAMLYYNYTWTGAIFKGYTKGFHTTTYNIMRNNVYEW